MQRLRPAVVRLREKLGPIALVVIHNGQTVLTDGVERFNPAVEYVGAVAGRLRPVRRAPAVVEDPERAFGQPAVRNVRSSTSPTPWTGTCSASPS